MRLSRNAKTVQTLQNGCLVVFYIKHGVIKEINSELAYLGNQGCRRCAIPRLIFIGDGSSSTHASSTF